MDWIGDLLERFVDGEDLVTGRRLLVSLDNGGETGAFAYLGLCRLIGEASNDPAGLLAALDEVGAVRVLDHVGMLVIACFASLRTNCPSRQDAQRGRAALAVRAESTVDDAGAVFGHVMHAWLQALTGETLIQLSQIAADRASLVRVETGISMPAVLLAWDLYGDPMRDAELVDRNECGTAFVMPTLLEALAP